MTEQAMGGPTPEQPAKDGIVEGCMPSAIGTIEEDTFDPADLHMDRILSCAESSLSVDDVVRLTHFHSVTHAEENVHFMGVADLVSGGYLGFGGYYSISYNSYSICRAFETEELEEAMQGVADPSTLRKL